MSGVDAPFATVVLNTYNRASKVRLALDSVLGQTDDDLEVVVVDDGSTDDTATAIEACDDPRVRYVRRPNGGLATARNTGLKEAGGRFVGFFDDDDTLEPTWLERLRAQLESQGAAVVSCGVRFRSPDGSAASTRLPGPLGPAFDDQVGLFLAGTFLARRDVLLGVGGFDEQLRCSEQTELSLRVLPYCVDRGLAITHVAEALMVATRESDEHRPLRRADYLHDGACRVLDVHRERLARNPRLHADFEAIAAVQGARMGQYRDARRHLRCAIAVDPSNPRHYARLFAAAIPLVGRRVWGTWSAPPST